MALGAALTTPSQTPSIPTGAPKPSAPTNPLAPLSPGQIKSQATSTISAAYKPVFTDINNQRNAANALDAKRAADETAYNAWLTSQSAALQANSQTLMGNLEQANSALHTNLSDSISKIVANSAASMAPTSANGQLVSALSKNDLNNDALRGQLSNTRGAIGASALAATTMNTYARQAQVRSQQVADLNNTLTSLANAQSKARAAEAGDTAKEIARLQGVEISKAQAAQNFAAATQKLGLTKAVDIANATHQHNQDVTAAANAKTAAGRLDLAKTLGASTIALNAARANDANAQAARAQAAAQGKKTATDVQTADVYNAIEATRGEISRLTNQGLTAQQAYHAIQQGGYNKLETTTHPATKSRKAYTTQKTVWVSTSRVPSTVANLNTILNAAYNLQTIGGINTNDLAALNSAGIYGVRGRYAVHSPHSAATPPSYGPNASNPGTQR